jgi:hypothetical protein
MTTLAAPLPQSQTARETVAALTAEHRQTGLLWCAALLVAALYAAAYFQSYTPPVMYAVCVLALYIAAPPKYLFSPRNFLAGYHMMFYAIPVMAAERYRNFDFGERAVVLSYLMLATSYIVSYLTLFHTETWLGGALWVQRFDPPAASSRRRSLAIAGLMIVVALVSAAGLIQVSGGVQHWLNDPGRAFLGREGGGVYYLGFILCLGIGSCALGVFSAQSRNLFMLIGCLLLIAACSPVIWGKGRTFTMLAFAVLPWTFYASVMSRSTLYLISGLVASFSALTYLRNMSWMTADDFLGYSLNYFDTFEFLVLSVGDFEPSWFQTLFLPFNKLLTPFGLGDQTRFYDMSNWLTSVYLPHIWALRCTVQWPIETDLYLSLYYVFGVPLLMLYVAAHGLLFNLAVRTRSVGLIYISAYATFYLITHLRGSLIIWTDFYTYPYWVLSFLLLRGLRMPDVTLRLRMPDFPGRPVRLPPPPPPRRTPTRLTPSRPLA